MTPVGILSVSCKREMEWKEKRKEVNESGSNKDKYKRDENRGGKKFGIIKVTGNK